jgi:hypothetical protein
MTWVPLDKLNVSRLQNAAALRYQIWYVRVAPAGTDALHRDRQVAALRIVRRVARVDLRAEADHRSRRATQTVAEDGAETAAACVVPWKYKAEEFGMRDPCMDERVVRDLLRCRSR